MLAHLEFTMSLLVQFCVYIILYYIPIPLLHWFLSLFIS